MTYGSTGERVRAGSRRSFKSQLSPIGRGMRANGIIGRIFAACGRGRTARWSSSEGQSLRPRSSSVADRSEVGAPPVGFHPKAVLRGHWPRLQKTGIGVAGSDYRNETLQFTCFADKAIGYWLLAIGYWLLAIGYWLLAIGYWLRIVFQ